MFVTSVNVIVQVFGWKMHLVYLLPTFTCISTKFSPSRFVNSYFWQQTLCKLLTNLRTKMSYSVFLFSTCVTVCPLDATLDNRKDSRGGNCTSASVFFQINIGFGLFCQSTMFVSWEMLVSLHWVPALNAILMLYTYFLGFDFLESSGYKLYQLYYFYNFRSNCKFFSEQ